MRSYVHGVLLGTHVSMCTITRERNRTYEEGTDKGISNRNKLIPIEGRGRIQSQTGHATRNRSELNILGGNPCNPVEVRHRLDDVVGEPEIDEHGNETVHEPSRSGDRPAVDRVIELGVEGTVNGNSRQVDGPDDPGWVDEEPTG